MRTAGSEMDEPARAFGRTHDEHIRLQIEALSVEPRSPDVESCYRRDLFGPHVDSLTYGGNMAAIKESSDATLLSAKQRILNRLCTGYIGSSKDGGFIPADKLRRELSIPENVFAEALNSFINAEKQLAVEVIESTGGKDLRLGESMRDLCSNWNLNQYKSVSNTNLSSGVSARRLLRRSA